MECEFEIGRETRTISIPEEKVLGVLTGRELPPLPLSEIQSRIEKAVLSALPHDPGQSKAVIIVPDHTRLWARGDIFVPVIVNTLLNSGYSPSRVKVMVALGTHPEPSGDMAPRLVGDETLSKVQVLSSAPFDKERQVHLGRTALGTPLWVTREAHEADFVIIFGGILHHIIAGFGGGRKYILPGIAGNESIQHNHSLALTPDGTPHPLATQASLNGNPVHEDMVDAAEIFLRNKRSLLINVAANGLGELFYVAIGDWKQAFEEGCLQVNRAGGVEIDEPGDFAVISAGGHRADNQLYQSTKALFNAYGAVREGGHIVMLAEARDGVGSEEFGHALTMFKHRPGDLGAKIGRKFSMPSYVAFRSLDLMSRYKVTLISGFSRAETEDMGFIHTSDLEACVRNLSGRGYLIPHAENILPMLKAGQYINTGDLTWAKASSVETHGI